MNDLLSQSPPRKPSVGGATVSLMLLWLVGCGPSPEAPAQKDSPAESTAPHDVPQSASRGSSPAKVKFKDGAGRTVFSFKKKEDGGKLVDASEKELARFNLNGDKLKVKDPQDIVLGYIVGAGDRFKVKDADQTITLFQLQKQTDGDWKLEDGKENLIYKIKKRDYGFEIEDVNDRSLAKIKVKRGKTSLRNAADQTRYATTDPVDPAAVACLGFDQMDNLPLCAALFLRVNQAKERFRIERNMNR